MKTIKFTILICLFTLFFVGYSFSGNAVIQDPVNIFAWSVNYEYREIHPPYWYPSYSDPPYLVGDTMFVGSEGVSGGYFILSAAIKPGFGGSCLTAHSQVREVKAKWLGEGEQEYEFSLLPGACFNEIPGVPGIHGWWLFLRPAAWQFQGTWEFTLKYYCPSDKTKYIQTREIQPNPAKSIPPKPSGILIEKSSEGNYFNVSWIGMGNRSTHPWLGHRVMVYNDEDSCPTHFYGDEYGPTSSYHDGANRITVKVPAIHAGKTIRIENRNYSGMPPLPPPPFTLGGSPNKAAVITRLPIPE